MFEARCCLIRPRITNVWKSSIAISRGNPHRCNESEGPTTMTERPEMGGIAIPMPKIFTMFSSFSMASLALPGMSGFVAELIVFFGLITSQKYLLMTKALITFVMAIGMILTPIYLLSMLRQMFYGYKIFNISNSYFSDSGPRELFLLISIFLPILGIGMYPDFLLSLSVEKVEVILSNSFYR
ncbi:hypothetical protein CASFOL_007727 [Castilleja foliolosa]|uniref:NADH dehydrogenase subunit 4 n=1 Tax=Castilleja foliolosa TaxID=1961234 RepID=A0ABD3E1N9_9LAMI